MSVYLKVVVFIVVSVGVVWLSRTSLRDVRSHGFYRCFAWEAILALILLNLNYWLREPLSAHQIVSWLLLIVCSALVIYGALSLRLLGKPDGKRDDPCLFGIERTTELVTVRAYRYVRHPIYGSLLFLAWGACLKHLAWLSVSLAVIATFFLTMTAKKEEAENVRFFGAAYQEYMRRTKMFVPFLF